ncbi:MAG: amino acid adenylation domain-containing protein [Rhodanobacteraceae bacterium]|nr:amino acid adenylation domain-containing protein [Rhodanobacteraceae bacterium]
MAIAKLLRKAADAGVFLSVHEGQLRFKLSTDTFPDALKQEIVAAKPELIAFLERSRARDGAAARRPILPGTAAGERVPASFAQQRLWFLDRLDGPSYRYNMPVAFRIEGRLDATLAERALAMLVQRHEPLRTVLVETPAGPLQQVCADAAFSLARDLPQDADVLKHAAHLQTLLDSEICKPFDLACDVLLRARLIGDGSSGSVLLLTLHHSAADGLSLGVLAREFSHLYASLQQQVPADLPPLPVRYADYAQWQLDRMGDVDMRTQLSYWSQQLQGLPGQFPLREDLARPRPARFRGARATFSLDVTTLAGLRHLARDEQCSLFMLLHAALAVLLARHGQTEDIVIGTPVANRAQRVLEGLIGLFVNTVILRCDCSGNPRFVDLLRQVRSVNLEAQANQEAPFDAVVAQLQGVRRSSGTAPFQVMLSMELDTLDSLVLPGAQLKRLPDAVIGTKVDLLISALEHNETLELRLDYDCDVFLAETIEAFGERLLRLLRGIVENAASPIGDLPLLSAQESAYLLRGLNDTARSYPLDRCIHELFEAQVDQTPDVSALKFENHELSYAQLDERANRLAHYLRAQGVGPDARVGLLVERSLEMVIGILGIFKAGGAYVPLDPAYPAQRLEFLLHDSAPQAVLTQTALRDRLPVSGMPTLCLDDAAAVLEEFPATRLSAADIGLTSRHLAYVIYTSGSTGQPKGVMNEHAPVLNRLLWARDAYAFGGGDRLLQKTPYSFDVSVGELLMPLLCGAQLVMARPGGHLDPDYLAATIAREQITMVHFVPSMLQMFLDHEVSAQCGSLRRVLCSGEALPYGLQQRFLASLPDVELHNLYGPTEAAIEVTTWRCRADTHPGIVPIGRPIANVRIYILDAQRKPVPRGVVGELYLGGICVARGYQNRADLSAAQFIADPFADDQAARLYRTGDLGRWLADGAIEYLGRNDNQVKIRGLRIELGEIEYRLAQLPGVASATVLAREDLPGQQRLVAYLTRSPGTLVDAGWAEDLRQELLAVLPDYLVPTQFVVLDALPLNSNGKVDRKALLARNDLAAAAQRYVAPRSEIEQQLVDIWQQLLQRDSVGVHDNFFEIGGNSLLSVRLRNEVMRALACELALTDLFEYPTIAQLARHLRAETTADVAPPPRTDLADINRSIAIIGMAGRFPGARDVAEFWQNLCDGVETLREFSTEELREAGVPAALLDRADFVRKGVLLEDLDLFDAEFFGLTPREAEQIDPQQRLLFECATTALEIGGYGDITQAQRVGVFVGMMDSVYLVENLLPSLDIWSPAMTAARVANSRDFAATRLAYKLNLSGPALTIATACSTSLVAVHQACASLRLGDCDMALAGAANVTRLRPHGYLYVDGDIRSRDGHCRTFDSAASGTRGGDGAGIVLLKRLDDAQRDGDTIYALILGTAINNDASDKVGYSAPSVAGQAAVVRAAFASAGVEPASVQYVEAHGTATRYGDPIEIRALSRAFGRLPAGSCLIGSVKPNIGHLDCAAGVAGLIKTALALHHGRVPPSLNFANPNPEIDFENSPFIVNKKLTDWPQHGSPRRAAVSSFGIGGTNAHAVLEQAPSQPARESRGGPELLLFSADSPAALCAQREQFVAFLQATPGLCLDDVAASLQLGRAARRCRDTLVAASLGEAIAQLHLLEKADPAAQLLTGQGAPGTVFLFSGQGVQYPQMGRGLYARFSAYRTCIDECAAELQPLLGLDLRAVLYPESDPEQAAHSLRNTVIAQPALFVTGLALARLLQSLGVAPQAMIGHGVGEYVAAHLAGVFDLATALRLVAVRARLMQSVEPGAMLAVALEPAAAAAVAMASGCELACVNEPAGCVLAGTSSAIAAAAAALDEAGVAHTPSLTSHASHGAMMDTALTEFAEAVGSAQLRSPVLPYVSTLSGDFIAAEQAIDPAYWVRQLRETVQFARGVDALLRSSVVGGDSVFLELGPGQTLCGFVHKHPAAASRTVLPTMRHSLAVEDDVAVLLRSLGQLWLHGVALDWGGLHERPRRIALPTYPFQRRRYWIDGPYAARPTEPASRDSAQADALYQPVWKLKPRRQAGARSAASWLVLGDGAALTQNTVSALRRAGASVVHTERALEFRRCDEQHYALPTTADALRELVQALGQSGFLPSGILLLDAALAPVPADNDGGVAAFLRDSCGALLELLGVLATQSMAAGLQLAVVTRGAQRVTGEEDLLVVADAVGALCKVTESEYPVLHCRQIDLAPREADLADSPQCRELANQLAHEILGGMDDRVTALRGRQRWVRVLEGLAVDAESMPRAVVRAGGSYVICCARSDAGIAIARQLQTAAEDLKIAVIAADGADVSETDRIGLAADGIEVVADAGNDAERLRRAFASQRQRSGRIDGVVYSAAPVPAERCALPQIAVQDLQASCSVSLQILAAIDAALDAEEADFIVLLSSLAAWCGESGQGVQAAANAQQDAYAQYRHQHGDTRWLSLNLGSRDDTAPNLLRSVLLAALAADAAPQLLYGSADELQRRRVRSSASASRPAAVLYRRGIAASARRVPTDEVERQLLQNWQELLGFADIGTEDDFFELGGDSLLATRAVNFVQLNFALDSEQFAIRHFFAVPTIAGVAARITAALMDGRANDQKKRLLDQGLAIEEGVL